MAGRRLREAVKQTLVSNGGGEFDDDTHIVIAGLTNTYSQYIATYEEYAQQRYEVQEQSGSFSNYCWQFVNHKPLRNGFRYACQVPVKTPKAEVISKDMMQRGFRCVGPTVVYSFMQVAGIVNDHLITCFRYQECNTDIKMGFTAKIKGTEVLTKALENKCSSRD